MQSDNDIILSRARVLTKGGGKNNLCSIATLALYDLEFPMNGQNFEYTKLSILCYYRRRPGVTAGQVYEEVAGSIDGGVLPKTIEQVVGYSIKKAWSDRAYAKWNLYFPAHVMRCKKAPSNTTFFNGIANFLDMVVECSEEVEYAAE